MKTLVQQVAELWWLVLLRGIAVLVLGFLFLTAPGATIATLAVFLGAYWFVDGIFSIVAIFVTKSEIPWGWSLLNGILGILAGLIVLKHPLTSALIVPAMVVILIGINGLIRGAISLYEGLKGAGASAIVIGVLNLLLGLLLLARPIIGVAALPFTLGILGVVGGIILIVNALKLRKLA